MDTESNFVHCWIEGTIGCRAKQNYLHVITEKLFEHMYSTAMNLTNKLSTEVKMLERWFQCTQNLKHLKY